MVMEALLWQYYKKNIARHFTVRRGAKLVTAALFLCVFAGVAFGIYVFFKSGFSFIAESQYFKDALTLYVFEAFTLITMLLVFFSVSITTLFSLFRTFQNEWILASPRFGLVLSDVMLRVFMSSLWPLVLIFLPGLIAVDVVFGIPVWGLIAVLVSVALLTLFIVLFVVAAIMIIAQFLHLVSKAISRNIFTFFNLVLVMLLLVVAFSWFAWHRGFDVNLINLLKAEDVSATAPNISVIQDRFFVFPSHTVAGAIFDWQHGKIGAAMALFGTLCALVAAVGAIWWMVKRWFLEQWQGLQHGRFIAATTSGTKARRVQAYRFRGGYVAALFKKEALVSVRSGQNVLWFCFLVFLWLIQVGLNVVLSRMIAEHELGGSGFPAVVQALQFITAIFFVSAFVLRFVFPSFSSERRTAWILASAPIRFHRVYWAKLLFYLIVFTSLGLLIGYANIALLRETLQSAGITFLLFVTALPLLIIYGLSLGALFPNFETDDPSALSTSLPGFGFIVGSLGYGAAGAWLLYAWLRGGSVIPIVLFEVVSVAICALLLYRAPRALEGVDFVKELG